MQRGNPDLAAGLENVLVSGRLTTDRGFVDVSSTNRLDLAFPSHGFSNGSLNLTGSTQVENLHSGLREVLYVAGRQAGPAGETRTQVVC